ncbi:2-oxoacid dehydrogenase acyltransferase protein [Rutstroemia sp. NJR-2017a BBW]|nr:2-oxoacid dehydrogenase acyltransferase protein [Rutstroemia sp. NJR-2017a BBW]
MLSDIGEVTEAESTPGKKLPGPAERRFLKQQQLQNGHRLSGATSQESIKRPRMGSHERKISVESSSTVTSEPQTAEMFGDIDDTVSVDDSNFQGDDEESVAESYTDSYRENIVAMESRRLSRNESYNEDDLNSSAALSRRAEQILLNAKRRLNNMEGNLSRARSSLMTPSPSISSIYSSSPLTKPILSPLQYDRRMSGLPSRQRSFNKYSSESTNSSPGHSRVWSENNISPSRATAFPVRASSAAGSYRPRGTLGNGTRSAQGSYGAEVATDAAHGKLVRSANSSPSFRVSPSQTSFLGPLSEDEVPGSEEDHNRTDAEREYLTPREGNGLSRSTSNSSLQMRDIQHQMHDLKGRLSALRDRARDDNMKRRSLQSLRTPSPFTAGEQWYSGGVIPKGQEESNDAAMNQPQWDGVKSSSEETPTEASQPSKKPAKASDSDAISIYEDVSENPPKPEEPFSPIKVLSPVDSQGYETAEESLVLGNHHNDYAESVADREEYDEADDSDASIYHESLIEQISHEDREDAFDYEHFFLHSALGTLTRERRDSFSSEDSVETTRGPPVPLPLIPEGSQSASERSPMSHLRSDSNSSVSTLASFATAKSNPEDDDDDEDPFSLTIPQKKTPSQKSFTPRESKRSTFGSLPPPITTIRDDQDIGIARGSGLFDLDVTQNLHSRSHSLDSTTSGIVYNFPKPNGIPPTSYTPPGTSSSSVTHPPRSTSLASHHKAPPSPVHMLAPDDQKLVERLVASLGKCVLGMQEAGPGSYDTRMWRRRLDAARRVLEGDEGAV